MIKVFPALEKREVSLKEFERLESPQHELHLALAGSANFQSGLKCRGMLDSGFEGAIALPRSAYEQMGGKVADNGYFVLQTANGCIPGHRVFVDLKIAGVTFTQVPAAIIDDESHGIVVGMGALQFLRGDLGRPNPKLQPDYDRIDQLESYWGKIQRLQIMQHR